MSETPKRPSRGPRADNRRQQPLQPAGWRPRPRKPELIKVTDRVYCSTGYAISNVLYVITSRSVVVIDTTESPKAARASFDDFRAVCRLPVSYIIYTHYHGDHVRGAKIFHTPETRVIAQEKMLEEREKMIELLPYKSRIDALQFGSALDARDRGISLESHRKKGVRPREIRAQSTFKDAGYIPPDVTFDEEYRFEEGGVRFELYHTEGETFGHLMVWLPEEGVLFPGDLFYTAFPMLSNPMKPDRPVLAWAESLDRMRALRPDYLVPSHSRPRRGAQKIDAALANYAKAIRYVHDETVRLINLGLPIEQIRRQVKLPEELSRLPYLQQGYGTVEWAVNGIFRQYTGWYDLNPTHFKPAPRVMRDRALLEACGGPEPIIHRARQALREGQNQLVLELTDIVLNARPQNPAAQEIRMKALNRLGTLATNGVEQNIYRTAAASLSRGMQFPQNADGKLRQSVNGGMKRNLAWDIENDPPNLPSVQWVSEVGANHNGGNATTAFTADVEEQGNRVDFVATAGPLFILGAPRSFTSVTCAMLGQHPEMYGLPELHPFVADTVSGRARFQGLVKFNIDAGLLRVVAQLFFGAQTADTIQLARGWLARRADFSPGYIIEQIGAKVSPRVLVEKSPSTGRAMEYLERASNMFPCARFLHLVRHPQSQCESLIAFVRRREMKRPRRHRLGRAHSQHHRPIRRKLDPQHLWLHVNRNICRFLRSVPAPHQRRVCGEDLLSDPDTHLGEIADWLGLRTDPEAIAAMKHPENSPYACFGPPGARAGNDTLFLENPVLRPNRSKPGSLEARLGWGSEGFLPQVKRLARTFGYQ